MWLWGGLKVRHPGQQDQGRGDDSLEKRPGTRDPQATLTDIEWVRFLCRWCCPIQDLTPAPGADYDHSQFVDEEAASQTIDKGLAPLGLETEKPRLQFKVEFKS